MPYQVRTSQFSFLQFDELDTITSCEFSPFDLCLPVFAPGDIAFQFVVVADTEEEADALCVQDDSPVIIGTIESCADSLTVWPDNLTRYRIGPLQVLYHWPHGITNLDEFDYGQCFRIGVEIFDQFFCSNCFQRIRSECHTSVVEYYNNENAFGFNYCAGETISESDTDCEPLVLEFIAQPTVTIVWTAYLQSIYGNTPTVEVWTYEGGDLIKAGQVVKFDTYPPTVITIDMGGPQSGVIFIKK